MDLSLPMTQENEDEPMELIEPMEPRTPIVSRKGRTTRRKNRTKVPQIFAGLNFVVSGVAPNVYSEVYQTIVSHGGKVIEFQTQDNLNDKQILFLSDAFHKTENYFLANLYEIPRLHINFVRECAIHQHLIPIVDHCEIERYLLPRGVLSSNYVRQEIPTTLHIMQQNIRVFAGLSFEVHLYSSEVARNQLIEKMIIVGGGVIVSEHTEPDTETTKLILYDDTLRDEKYQSVLDRANQLSIFIVNQLYIQSCVIEGQVVEITKAFSPNIDTLLAVPEEPTEQKQQEEQIVVEQSSQEIVEHVASSQSSTNSNSSSSSSFNEEWIYDLKEKQCLIITGFRRTSNLSFTQRKTVIFRLGDTVKLVNKQIVHICEFRQTENSMMFVFREFSGEKLARVYAKYKEELPINLIDKKVAVYISKEDYNTMQAICLDKIVGNKLVPLTQAEQVWNEETTYATITTAHQTQSSTNASASLEHIQFMWIQPTMKTSTMAEYDCFLFQGKPFSKKSYVRIHKVGENTIIARITDLRQYTQSNVNEIEYRVYQIDGRCLKKTPDVGRLSFSMLSEVVASMTELTIATKSQIEKNKVLRSDTNCFYVE